MTKYYWISGTASNFNNSANWATSSGGSGPAGPPGASDDVEFDANGVGDCQFDTAFSGATLTTTSGYSGSLDMATDNLNHSFSGDVVIGGGTLTPGTGTVTVSGGFSTTGSATIGNNDLKLTMDGTSKTLSLATNENVEDFVCSGSVTLDSGSSQLRPNDLNVSGTFTMDATVLLSATLTVASTGTITSSNSALLRLQNVTTYSIHASATIENVQVDFLTTAAGTYPIPAHDFSSCVWVRFNSTTNGTASLVPESGTITVPDLQINASTASRHTIVTNSTNNPSWVITGNVSASISGDMTWTAGTGTITASGTNAQSWQWYDANMTSIQTLEDITVNKSAETLTLSSDIKSESFTGTDGDLSLGGAYSWETTGNFTVSAGFTFDLTGLAGGDITVGGNLSISGTGIGSELDLRAGSAWTLSVTGTAAASSVIVSNSDASGGTAITATNGYDGGSNTNWSGLAGIGSGTVRYWVGGSALDWSSSNWAASSGGASGASIPNYGNIATFDGNGTGNCQLDIALVDSVEIDASAVGYTGTLDGATDGLDHSFADVTINANATLSLDGSCTVSGNIDIDGTFSANTSTVTCTGHSKTIDHSSDLTFYNLAFSSSGTYTENSSANLICSNSLNVDGTFVATNPIVRITGGTLTVGAGKTFNGVLFEMTSTGNSLSLGAGAVLTWSTGWTLNNTMTIPTFSYQAIDTFTLACSVDSATQTFTTGSIVNFNNLALEATGTSQTIAVDASVNNSSFIIYGDVSVDIGSGCNMTWSAGSGSVSAEGTAAQTWQWYDADMAAIQSLGEIYISKTAGVLDLGSNIKGALASLGDGELDLNGYSFETTGDFSNAAGFTFDLAGLAGANITVGGNLSLAGTGAGSELDLQAASSWTLSVTGTAAADYVKVKNSDASGGTEIAATNSLDYGGNINWSGLTAIGGDAGGLMLLGVGI